MNLNERPLPLNIIDRDLLYRTVTDHLIPPKDPRTKPRLIGLVQTSLVKKIFSAVFYALLSTLQDSRNHFMNFTRYFYKKYFMLQTRLSQPKEPILEVLPFIIGKAVLRSF